MFQEVPDMQPKMQRFGISLKHQTIPTPALFRPRMLPHQRQSKHIFKDNSSHYHSLPHRPHQPLQSST